MNSINNTKFPLDFLIIGTMKSGTSTLSFNLNQYENISLPDKEIHYFDRNFHRGNEWYKMKLLESAKPSTLLYGEKTPIYCRKEEYLKEIQALAPSVKLLWIFRNPVERTWSHYLHNIKNGRKLLRFEHALQKEEKRIKKDLLYGYVSASRYADQVKMAMRYFPAAQMHFLLFEEYIQNPEKSIAGILHFLGVNKMPEMKPIVHKHQTRMPRYPFTLFFADKFFGRGGRVWNYLYRYNTEILPTEAPPKINPETESKLKAYFAPLNAELKQLTSLDTDIWNKK